jgi:hypothetical protein
MGVLRDQTQPGRPRLLRPAPRCRRPPPPSPTRPGKSPRRDPPRLPAPPHQIRRTNSVVAPPEHRNRRRRLTSYAPGMSNHKSRVHYIGARPPPAGPPTAPPNSSRCHPSRRPTYEHALIIDAGGRAASGGCNGWSVIITARSERVAGHQHRTSVVMTRWLCLIAPCTSRLGC